MWRSFTSSSIYKKLFKSNPKDEKRSNSPQKQNINLKIEKKNVEDETTTSQQLTSRNMKDIPILELQKAYDEIKRSVTVCEKEIEEDKYIEPVEEKENYENQDIIDELKQEHEAKSHKTKLSPTIDIYMSKVEEVPKYYDQCSPRYLSRNNFEKVVIASYPRSGNTLLRKYIEDITKVVTGSDSIK